jgi:hypothetical protein
MNRKRILRTYDLCPDGVRIEVNWDAFVVGASLFVPCINTEEAKKQSVKIFADKGWQLEHCIRIENGYLGLRIWRTL